MEISLPVYLISLGVMVVLTIGIALRAFANWRRPGARTLGSLMLAMTVWTGFTMLEILHPELQVKIIARKCLYFGMTMSPPFWLGFALRYTGISPWWSRHGRVFLLAVPGLIAFLFGVTNEYHQLIWSSISAPAYHPHPLDLKFGFGFWAFTTIAYLLIGIGIGIYLYVFYKSASHIRAKTGVMLAGVLLTAVVNIVFLLSHNPIMLDPTPLTFGLSAPSLAFGFFRFGLSSLLPLAAPLVIDELRDAIIIVNPGGRITDTNHAAKQLLGMEAIGEDAPAFDLLPHADRFRDVWESPNATLELELVHDGDVKSYKARVVPLGGTEKAPLGRMVIFHDITRERSLLDAERRRSQQLALLEESGRIVADSFDETEILQRAVDIIIQRFGYAEAAISKWIEPDILECAAIAGTEDFGYRPGFRQKAGEGIIGHTALSRTTYLTNDVAGDPHYFSSAIRSGSAICVPIRNHTGVYGVLYVESSQCDAFDDLDVKTLETLASQVAASVQRASLHTKTRENLRVLSMMQDVSKTIAGSLDMDTISRRVVNGLAEAFGYTHVSIYLLEDEHLHLAAEVGYPVEKIIWKLHISQGVMGRTVRTKSVQFIEDTSLDEAFLQADNYITSEISVPLLKEGEVLGVLNVETNSMRKLTSVDVDLLVAIASQIAITVDNARLHAQVKKLATTDAVTGLANRHVFEQALLVETERARRQGKNLSLIIFDIDSFKHYNDTWGHPAGDARLKAVADIVKKNLRTYDIAARYGGDEFAIILSNTDQRQALLFARRLSEAAQSGTGQLPTEGLGIPGHTFSMGVATYPQDASNREQLLVAADNAALRAKHLGKNRIQVAGDMPPK